MEKEQKLAGGESGDEIVRIGNKVHRGQSSNSPFVHELLLHLEKRGFSYAPRFLGIDEKNREILSYIEGTVPRGESQLDENSIAQAMKILRNFHDATAGSEIVGESEVICHNDFAPWNVIFDKEKMVGIIDFNGAKPGVRIDDIAYLLWTFLGLGDTLRAKEALGILGRLAFAYGGFDPTDFVPALLRQQRIVLEMRKTRAINHPEKEARIFSAERVLRIEKEIQWALDNSEAINEVLKI